MADEVQAKSRTIESQWATIRKLRAMLTEKYENTDVIENPGPPKPARDRYQLIKEDEMPCDCSGSEDICMVEYDVKKELKIEIKEEIEDITSDCIAECYFGECFVDMGSRHLDHPLLKELDLDKRAPKQERISKPNTPPKLSSSGCNSLREEKKNTSRSSSQRRRKTTRSCRREFPCEDCDFHCRKLSEFIEHASRKHGRLPYFCKTCGSQFHRLGDMKRHLMAHTGEKPFACTICGMRFSRRGALMGRHMNVHRTGDDKPFSCNLCDYKSSRKEHLRSHIARIHHREKPYACDVCGHKVCLPAELKRHMVRHSGISEGMDRPRRLYQCYSCEFETHSRHGICEHLRRHSGEKPYLCSHCDYKAAAIKDVRRHARKQHHSARTYIHKKKRSLF